jgi:hypothetical protein
MLGAGGSSVSIVPGYRLDDWGFDSQQRQKIFHLACVQTGSEAHPASCAVDTGIFSRG